MLNDATSGGHRWLRRGIADFALALALFWAVALEVNGEHTRAHAVPAPRISEEAIRHSALTNPAGWQSALADASASAGRTPAADQKQALVLLSLAFAALTALNLAFLRHLRRVYASPRRGVWRRAR